MKSTMQRTQGINILITFCNLWLQYANKVMSCGIEYKKLKIHLIKSNLENNLKPQTNRPTKC